ncbi:hypothetical protein SLEP1_g57000 [Rubroshorea leprosula]|uniref:Disease resistance protein RGA3 n=1 Tax=Rubroshorea leprosula TaxID=152421 RepID=A0AAV5MNW5_9ROSI|nr:hypothetical protein SLEP1_g57000 [Rubroshorea leprosula]
MAELALNFVSPIIKTAVSKAFSFAAAQISTAWGLEKKLGKLAQKLTMIQGLLQDAEERQESNPAIRSWLQHLTDVAYEAVDVLDEYEYEVLKHKVQTQGRKMKKVRTFFGVFNRTAFRLSMADKIRTINKDLDEINNQGVLYLSIRFSDQCHSTAGARQYPETDPIPDCSKFVGRHNDVLEIVKKLDNIRSQHILSGISIVGFGGIGKTTLAKSICSMVKEQKLYDLVAWVCVSEEFDEKIILGDMLEYLGSSVGRKNNIGALIQELGQKLEDRKFLLVLDDLWNEDRGKWDSFNSRLLKILKTNGNSILVTTRSDKVASIMEALPMQKHDMVKLSDHECWLIIEDTVLRSSTETSIPLDLEGIGQEIAKKYDLIQLWVAQGFVHKSNESLVEMEDIGKEYFKELLSNSLFQDIGWDLYGNIESCKMHDLVHDLSLLVSKGKTLVWDTSCNSDVQKCSTIRHLRVKSKGQDLPRSVAQRLHSLFSNVDFFCSMASDLKSLRSLKLEGGWKKLPASLGKLKHLRYLDISKTFVRTLPKSFSKLYNLQTSKFPDDDTLKTLITWRPVYDDRPRDISIMQLTSLRTLSHFAVGTKKGRRIEDLGCLSQLGGKLEIWKLEHVRSQLEASKAELKEKAKLHQLKLCWSSGYEGAVNNKDEEVLESLQPHSNLKSLTIYGYKGKMFPSWMGNDVNGSGSSFLLDNMVELELTYCNECTCIPNLGLLPFLKVLYIGKMGNVRRMGHKLQLGGGESIKLFPALKTLTVEYMRRLEEWVEVVEDAAVGSQGVIVFPCLEHVKISNCPWLETWRMGGFSSHHKLSWLEIWCCQKLMAIPSLDGLSTLKDFCLVDNNGLTSLPIGLVSCISFQFLRIESCRNLNFPSINGFTSLEHVRLSRCDGLRCLPIGLDSCISLQKLEIGNCPNLISISDDIKKLRSLNILVIAHCKNLRSLPEEWLDSLTRLKNLRLGPFCSELEEFPGLTSIHQFHPSLELLDLSGWDKLKSLPHQLRHLTALKELRLRNFNGLEALPEWLGDFSSLHQLEIGKCSDLTHLPSIEAMRGLCNLKYLTIVDCPKLKKRCAKKRGPEWSKISHIPNINIQGKNVQGKYQHPSSGMFNLWNPNPFIPHHLSIMLIRNLTAVKHFFLIFYFGKKTRPLL